MDVCVWLLAVCLQTRKASQQMSQQNKHTNKQRYINNSHSIKHFFTVLTVVTTKFFGKLRPCPKNIWTTGQSMTTRLIREFKSQQSWHIVWLLKGKLYVSSMTMNITFCHSHPVFRLGDTHLALDWSESKWSWILKCQFLKSFVWTGVTSNSWRLLSQQQFQTQLELIIPWQHQCFFVKFRSV